ncbi:GNAT family N-acetyltransferase [Trinickia dabaoshanensis]|uniref:GNAT family N-acetyltransferase n=2 Tax=Trinickia dabaoshanensis TaxID=564714 RepID=A0A2N7VJE9_9BURK|nr:GNAT family N-acetyltransferase [Trinickia dabaoshanensis]PMS17289.1 GNAT family N-acetyltransferase [Trinickia dabaoshanensis]
MIAIRKATRSDAHDAWYIRRDALLDKCASDYPGTVLAAWTDGAPGEKWTNLVERGFYVATENVAVVATGMLTVATGQIDAIFVRPSHMGLGVGRRMMDFLENLARQHGVTTMRLDATLNAAPFYRRCGWAGETIGTYRSPRGIELACVPMTKTVGVAT